MLISSDAYGVHAKCITRHIVEPGETLSSIALQYDPNDNQNSVIGWIEEHNHLTTEILQIGQALSVPMNKDGEA